MPVEHGRCAAIRREKALPCQCFMRHDVQFPGTKGRAKGGGIGISGIKRGEIGARIIKVEDGLPQLVIAAPCADQHKAKAGGALMKDDETCDVSGEAGGETFKGGLGL